MTPREKTPATTDEFQCALATLVDGPVDGLLAGWRRHVVAFRASSRLMDLTSRERIEEWVNARNLQYPQFTVALGGTSVDASKLTRSRRVFGRDLHGFLDPEKVVAQIREGATIQFGDFGSWEPGAGEFCREVSRTLGSAVSAVAFLTPPNEYGLDVHRDDADVVVAQVSGTKTWEIYDETPPSSWQPGLDPAPGDSRSIELGPGDALYVPAGIAHRARAGADGSLHTTLTIREPHARDAFEIWSEAIQARLRSHHFLSGSRDQRVAAIRTLLDDLARSLGETDPEALLEAIEQRAIARLGSWQQLRP